MYSPTGLAASFLWEQRLHRALLHTSSKFIALLGFTLNRMIRIYPPHLCPSSTTGTTYLSIDLLASLSSEVHLCVWSQTHVFGINRSLGCRFSGWVCLVPNTCVFGTKHSLVVVSPGGAWLASSLFRENLGLVTF